jgi:glycine/D-amino acid oxidase-like deaminating enzyme
LNNSFKHERERILIVGGGISGLSIAVCLSQSGLPVIVLESGDLDQGPSSRNQGWLYSGAWFAPKQPNLARLCYESLNETIRVCDECLEPATSPMIYLVSSPSTSVSHWTNAWKAAGIPYGSVSAADAVAETGIAESLVRHAFRLPDRAIRTDVLLEFLTVKAEHQGVEVRTKTRVTRLLKDGDQICGVVTASGEEITARLVILAANVGGVDLYPRPTSKAGQQTEFTKVRLKTHCLTIQPSLAKSPFCVVDLEGFNHIPHGVHSVFGSSRWLRVTDIHDRGVVPGEIDRLQTLLATAYPQFQSADHEILEWGGSTVQAMHVDQVEPGLAPMPTVIDQECEPPRFTNLLSVFPGRATLWPQLAKMTRIAVLDKIQLQNHR